MPLTHTDLAAIRNVFNEGITELVLPQFEQVYRSLGTVEQRLDNIERDVAEIRNVILADYFKRLQHVEADVALLKQKV